MTLQKITPLILLMFTVLCALPAATAVGTIPSAFAQEDDNDENFVGNIVSKALGDGGGIAEDGEDNQEDATNTADDDSNQEQDVNQDDTSTLGDDDVDLDDINVAIPIGIPIDVQEEEEEIVTPPPSDDGELPPECSLEITTDKETYGPEDTIAITITNTGDIPIVFPDSFLGLEIRNVDTGEAFAPDATPGVFTFGPGASAKFEFTYEELASEIGTGLISATVPSPCDTVEEVTFTLSAPPPPPIPTAFCLTVEFTSTVVETDCFPSEEQCVTGEQLLRGSFAFSRIVSSCEGFETLPAGGHSCNVLEAIPEEDVPRRISCSS